MFVLSKTSIAEWIFKKSGRETKASYSQEIPVYLDQEADETPVLFLKTETHNCYHKISN